MIIGGGDTGADCLGTAHRQGAASVVQLEIMPRPPDSRADSTPWPTWPLMYRVSSAHEEGGDRLFSVSTRRFIGEERVRALELVEVEMVDGKFEEVAGTEREIPADLVLLAMGFTGPERGPLLEGLGRRARRARQRGAFGRLGDHRARRLCLRRRRPRPVADRLGHRRGPGLRGRRRPPLGGSHAVAVANPDDDPLTPRVAPLPPGSDQPTFSFTRAGPLPRRRLLPIEEHRTQQRPVNPQRSAELKR